MSLNIVNSFKFVRPVDLAELKAYYQFDNDPTTGDLPNKASTIGSNASVPDGDGQNTDVVSGTGIINEAYNYVSATAKTVLGTSLSQFNFIHEPNGKWSIVGWINSPTTVTSTQTIFDNTDSASANSGILITLRSSRGFRVQGLGDGVQWVDFNSAGNFVPVEGSGFYFFMIRWDGTLASNQLEVSINDGVKQLTSRANPEPVGDSTFAMQMGQTAGLGGLPLTGLLDEISIWNRVLTDAEVTTIFNGGAGIVL